MRRSLWLLPLLLFLAACPKDKDARDVAAALSGVLVTAQDEYAPICVSNPALPNCVAIHKGVAAQGALITAIETYCGMALTPVPPPPSAKCTPVSSTEAALALAVSNANQSITDVKALLH